MWALKMEMWDGVASMAHAEAHGRFNLSLATSVGVWASKLATGEQAPFGSVNASAPDWRIGCNKGRGLRRPKYLMACAVKHLDKVDIAQSVQGERV